MNDASSEASIRVPKVEEWGGLPVQPPAGRYRYWLRYPMYVTLTAVLAFFGLVFTHYERAVTVAFAILEAGVAVCVLGAALAYRPYRAERKQWYTTWPSALEAKEALDER